MRTNVVTRGVNAVLVASMCMVAMVGCGSKEAEVETAKVEIVDEQAPASAFVNAGYVKALRSEEEIIATNSSLEEKRSAEEDVTKYFVLEDDHVPMNISGCATFTDIVNKLEKGQAYSQTTISGTDVLMVSESPFSFNSNGSESEANDSEIYRYNEGEIEYLGHVTSGGTAYPLMICDDDLYTAGNHFVRKYKIDESGLVLAKEIWVNYDSDGIGTYYRIEDGKTEILDPDDEDVFTMYDFVDYGTIIVFDAIQ